MVDWREGRVQGWALRERVCVKEREQCNIIIQST